jgi:L-ascorbate metabolism protein UlaG (beta-lactamase superfamily)
MQSRSCAANEGDDRMDRRMFLRKFLDLGKKAAFLHLLAGCTNLKTSAGQTAEEAPPSPFKDYSLRELAQEKLHHGDDRFVNPFSNKEHGNMLRVLHWKLFSQNQFRSYYDLEQVVPVSIDWEPIRDHGNLSITFIKHASVMIKDQDQYILVDPVFFEIFRFIKDFSPLESDVREIPRPDHVLISHGHYDHLDTRSLSSLRRDTHVISPLGYDDIFADLKMNNRTQLWGSYILKTASGMTIYLSADTAYFDRFQEIGSEFSIDLAIINLGAYEPRWFMAGSHMNPSDTVQAFKELGAARLMVTHWGTFRLGDEPVYFPPMEIKREMEKEGLSDRLVHLNHGETLFL